MRNLNGIKLICALAMFGATASADVIIDSQSIPGAEIESIIIGPLSGDVFITTTTGYTVTPTVVGSTVAITGFSVSPNPVVAGSNATLSWNTSNAVACTASGGVGGWAETSIGLPSSSTSVSTSTAGEVTFTLSCNGSAEGDTTTRDVSLSVTEPGSVAITSFTVSPSTITEGQSTTVSWTTDNAVSCTPSGGTGDWSSRSIGTSGSTTITASAAASYVFTLTCNDSGTGEDTSNAPLTVNTVTTTDCAATPISGSVGKWENFWSAAFPYPGSETTHFEIPRLGYGALKFNTGNVVDDGKISSIETTITDGLRLGSISECPGDFNVPAECTHLWGIGGGIRWATNGRSGACQLKPNTDYYFNITFTDGVTPSTTSCRTSPCVTALQYRF